MTLIEVATTIGNVLTHLDTMLQTPGLSDPDWQTLYALRKHLDDQQRDLIGESINESDAEFQTLTTQMKSAAADLAKTVADLAKVNKVIGIVSQVASYADKILDKVA